MRESGSFLSAEQRAALEQCTTWTPDYPSYVLRRRAGLYLEVLLGHMGNASGGAAGAPVQLSDLYRLYILRETADSIRISAAALNQAASLSEASFLRSQEALAAAPKRLGEESLFSFGSLSDPSRLQHRSSQIEAIAGDLEQKAWEWEQIVQSLGEPSGP